MEFERTYYKNIKGNSYVYILDELLGIEKYKRVEGNLKGEILEKSADVSYQKAAELSIPVSLTRETVKKIIRENGSIDNLELEVKEKRVLKLDEKVINRAKRIYNTMEPDIMIDMPYISRTDGRWLKDMLRASYF